MLVEFMILCGIWGLLYEGLWKSWLKPEYKKTLSGFQKPKTDAAMAKLERAKVVLREKWKNNHDRVYAADQIRLSYEDRDKRCGCGCGMRVV